MATTALLVIDVQSALIASADRGADVLAVVRGLVVRARAAGTPVIYLQHCHSELDHLGIKRLIICGLQTEFCVDATCRAAFSRGFEVVLASDAHTTTDAVAPASIVVRHHNYALANLAHPHRKIAVIPSAEIDVG